MNMKKPVKKPPSDIELRRWCIDQALRWPNNHPNPNQQLGAYMNYAEVDVLGRAKRILDWVTQTTG